MHPQQLLLSTLALLGAASALPAPAPVADVSSQRDATPVKERTWNNWYDAKRDVSPRKNNWNNWYDKKRDINPREEETWHNWYDAKRDGGPAQDE